MATVPDLGDLPTEADKLLTVLADRLAHWRAQQDGRRPDDAEQADETPDSAGSHETDQPTAPSAPPPSHTQSTAGPCTSCPWCRWQAAWQQQRPEVTAALVEAASLAVAALQTVLHSPPFRPENPGPEHAHVGSPRPAQAPSGDSVRPGSGPDHASTEPEETKPVPAAADGITLQRIPIR